jgi:chaperonin GroES
MAITPLHDRILVERLEAEEKTSGGIIIPDNAKEKPQKGKVVAVGGGNKDEKGNRIALDVKKGDVVLFAKWGGTEVNFEGKEYLIMKESDVLAIIEDAASKKKAA